MSIFWLSVLGVHLSSDERIERSDRNEKMKRGEFPYFGSSYYLSRY